MSERFPASIVRATPVVPNAASAPGVWTMEQQLQAQAQGIWPANPSLADPYFDQVTLLLRGEGTNGAQNNTFLNTPITAIGSYAGYFDGSGDYLTISTGSSVAFGTGDFTVEFWLYFVAVDPDFDIFVATSTMNIGFYQAQGWGLTYNNGIGGFPGSYKIQSGVTPPLNTWAHIACCRASGVTRLFVNGVQAGSSYTDTTSYAAGTTTVGNSGYSPNAYISNVRILNGVGLYSGTFTPPTSPLAAVSGTSLLTCQNATFIDNSSNAFAVTASGNATVVNSGVVPAITRNGNVSQGSFSPFGTLWSYYFDGGLDYILTGTNGAFGLGTGDFTIECWAQLSASGTTNGYCLFDMRSQGGTELRPQIGVTSAGAVTYWTQASVKINGGTFPVGVWNHVAVSRSSGSTKLFVNGVQVGSTYADTTDYGASARVTIGNTGDNPGGYNASWNGHVSNFRIVKGTALYTANFTPPGSPLTAVTNTVFLTCQSNRLVDNSVTAAAITRGNDVRVTRYSPFAPSTAYNASVLGGSAYFDGTGDYLSTTLTGQAPGTGNFTYEGWFYVSSLAATRAIFNTRSGDTSDGFDCVISTAGAIVISYTSTGLFTSASGVVTVGQWYHIAVVRTSTSVVTVYLNGVALGNWTAGTGQNFTSTTLFVGAAALAGVPMFGYISNFRYTKSAVYTANFTPATAPLSVLSDTRFLAEMNNAAIVDSAMQVPLETVGTAQINTSFKKFGTSSIYLNGSGNRLTLPGNLLSITFGSADFTVEAWVYKTSTTATQTILVGQGDNASVAGSAFVCYIGTGTSDLYIGSTGYSAASPNPPLNTWAHVAYVRYGATWKTYLDGVQVGSVGVPATGVINIGATVTLPTIGAIPPTTNQFTGYIDDLRVTKGVARYTANFTPPTATFNTQ